MLKIVATQLEPRHNSHSASAQAELYRPGIVYSVYSPKCALKAKILLFLIIFDDVLFKTSAYFSASRVVLKSAEVQQTFAVFPLRNASQPRKHGKLGKSVQPIDSTCLKHRGNFSCVAWLVEVDNLTLQYLKSTASVIASVVHVQKTCVASAGEYVLIV